MRKLLFRQAGLVVAISTVLVGCGGTGQDEGVSANIREPISGLAIDGYLARSTVYLDTNNNGTRDPWEPYAFTDNDGYYSYNPKTDTNYCASNATAMDQQYCLVSNTALADVVVRIDGGYDILTGEPFLGQMSRRLSVADRNEANYTSPLVLSPITTLLSNIDIESDRTSMVSSLGIELSDINIDYLNVNNPRPDLMSTALTIHKTVTILSDRLNDTYTEIGKEVGVASDPSSYVYRSLAEVMLASPTPEPFRDTLSDTSSLSRVLDNAETSLRDIYDRKEIDLPEVTGRVPSQQQLDRTLHLASNIGSVVDRLVSVEQESGRTALESATSVSKLLESFVIKSVDEGENENPSIDASLQFFTDDSNKPLLEALLDSASRDNLFVSELVLNDFSGDDFDDVEDMGNVASLPEGTTPFSGVVGMSLRVGDLNIRTNENNLKDSEVKLYFKGEAGDVDGELIACAKHIDGAKSNGSLGEGNTRGELVNGFWSLLGANENAESHSLLMTVTFLGTTYQAIIKPAGMGMVDNQNYHVYRFDFDDDFRSWHSVDGIQEAGVLPSNSLDCEDELPSRVGLQKAI
ncbi:hypothetical protein [Teredinibacter waterburyi]|uniref:hypothetical protein n=1 Tax=Teredinibacter waterburyi TaxID=1500538 RepID=UPI00165FF83F|nr:hypothetical protein [Teredinibacter waterburyi]